MCKVINLKGRNEVDFNELNGNNIETVNKYIKAAGA